MLTARDLLSCLQERSTVKRFALNVRASALVRSGARALARAGHPGRVSWLLQGLVREMDRGNAAGEDPNQHLTHRIMWQITTIQIEPFSRLRRGVTWYRRNLYFKVQISTLVSRIEVADVS